MAEEISSGDNGKQEPMKEGQAPGSLAYRAGLFVVFLICALAIFVFGPNYYRMFPTNGSSLYAASLAAVFLVAAVLFKRSQKFFKYWQIAYAFFVAAVVNLVSALFAGYNSTILQALGVSIDTNAGLAVAKMYDTLLVVIPIIVLVKLSGADLGSLFLKKGNLKLGLGIGTLVLVNFLTSALIFFGPGYDPIAKLGSVIIWGAVFSFSNAFLEELWFRGLFIKRLAPLIGFTGTVLLTSVWFGLIHFLAVAYLPAAVIPVFFINTFTLGLACGYLMLKTDSIWGPVMIHAAADLFLFIATLAYH